MHAGSELTTTVVDSRLNEDAATGLNQSDLWCFFEMELEGRDQVLIGIPKLKYPGRHTD